VIQLLGVKINKNTVVYRTWDWTVRKHVAAHRIMVSTENDRCNRCKENLQTCKQSVCELKH